MGLIKAVTTAIGKNFADQWLEVFEPGDRGDQTVFTSGVRIRKGSNVKGTDNTVSNGSVIHVYENQFMMVVDGGKIVDYTAEPGYFTVDNSSLPSLFNGQLGDSVKETFQRVKYGGETPREQRVFYINLQEIKGIKFGTRTPINYFDNFYNAELFLRAHGTYSIKIVEPLRFYAEAVPRNKDHVEITEINEQYISEFLEALQSSINQMSADGIRISHVASRGMELGNYMEKALDEKWNTLRGMEIQSVGIASISYDEESQKLINMRNQGAMLSDPGVREGYVQGALARGMEAAGSNANGAMAGFMGVGMGMNTTGNMMGAASAANMQQMQMNQANQAVSGQAPQTAGVSGAAAGAAGAAGWTCECGHVNTGKFCSECGKPKPEPAEWTCECGHVNTGKFCPECGKPRPAAEWTCECGHVNTGKFCSECGKTRP